jgi:hypothetical protein
MDSNKSLTQSRKDAKNTSEAAPCRFEVEDLARLSGEPVRECILGLPLEYRESVGRDIQRSNWDGYEVLG